MEKLTDGTLTENPLSGVRFYLYAEDGTRIGGIYTTDELGKIAVSLPEGKYFFEEIAPKYGYDYDKNEDGTAITQYWFTVTKSEEQLVIRVYNVRKTGSLTIEKWVQNADGSELTEDQIAQEFTFKVTFSDGGTYSYRIDGGELQSIASGEYLSLKHGQKAVFEGIPTGVIYTVTEETSVLEQGQYFVSADHHRGTITEEISAAVFTNIYREEVLEPLPVKIKVTKEVSGPVPSEDADKAFDMTIDINGTSTDFALKDGESMEFDAVVGDIYEVTEKDYTSEGYVQEIVGGMGTVVGDTEVLVHNRYGKEISKDIYVEKIWNLNGQSNAVLPKSITVQLKQGDVVVDEKKVTPNAEGVWSVTFDAPKYDAEGNEIVYTVVELPVEGFQTSYDTSRAEEGIIYIVNTIPNPTQITLPNIEKKVIGEDAPLAKFEFWLRGENNAPMPDGAVGDTKIVALDRTGVVCLGNITFTKAGEYRYTLTEVNGGLEHWTYDQSVYTLVVNVYETEGGLVAEQTILKDGNWIDRILFQNTYAEEEKPTVPPENPEPEKPIPTPEDPEPEKPTPEDPTTEQPDSDKSDSDKPEEGTSGGENADADSAGGSNKAETNKPTGAASQTGDQTKYGRYLWLLLISAAVIGAVVYQQEKRKKK